MANPKLASVEARAVALQQAKEIEAAFPSRRQACRGAGWTYDVIGEIYRGPVTVHACELVRAAYVRFLNGELRYKPRLPGQGMTLGGLVHPMELSSEERKETVEMVLEMRTRFRTWDEVGKFVGIKGSRLSAVAKRSEVPGRPTLEKVRNAFLKLENP